MKTKTLLAKALRNAEIDHVFGIPSYVGMQLIEAFEAEDMKIILNAHEQNAAHMAEGYYHATKKPAVLSVAIGPGITNAITGIANAYIESLPMIIVAAEAKKAFQGRNEYHANTGIGRTLDENLLLKSCTKGIFRITSKDNAASQIYSAIRTSISGRKGPVFISISPEIQLDDINIETVLNPENYSTSKDLDQKVVIPESFYKLWEISKRPVFILGKEVENSNKLYSILKDNCPFITTYGGKR